MTQLTFFFCMCRRISSVCVICGIWLFNLHVERVEEGSHSSGLYNVTRPNASPLIHTEGTLRWGKDSPDFLVKTVNFRELKPRPFSLVIPKLCLVQTTNFTIKTFIQIIKEQKCQCQCKCQFTGLGSPSVGVTWVSSETGWAPCTYTSGTVRPASSVPSPPSRYLAAS